MARGTHCDTLLVASVGGHLSELIEVVPRLGDREPSHWVTFDSPHSRSALHGASVDYVPYVEPRGYLALLRNLPRAMRILGRQRPRRVISTGAAIALPYLAMARLVGAEAYYIESTARTDSPSRTGELLARLPWVHLLTQNPTWADERWRYDGSVFDGFSASHGPPPTIRRVVVTVGTMETYGFRRLIEKLMELLPSEAEVLWQTGSTDVTGLDIDGRRAVDSAELDAAIERADLVVAHAGIGTTLTCLSHGRLPLLVPRDPAFDEHVDGHQIETAGYLADQRLAVVARVEELTREHLARAAGATVERVHDASPWPTFVS